LSALDFAKMQHHPAVTELVDVLCSRTEKKDRGFFQATVAYYLSMMASSMRATIELKNKSEIPVNAYVIALAKSGYGKGHSVYIMEENIMKPFRDRFKEDTFPTIAEQSLWAHANKRAAHNGTDQQEEYDRLSKEYKRLGPFEFDFGDATVAAVRDARQKLLLGGAGSISLQIDEIGSNLLGAADVLTIYLELFEQGIVKRKLLKNTVDNPRGETLEGKTPANMLLFGTPIKLMDGGPVEKEFDSFLKIGYARRCIFGFGEHIVDPNKPAETAEEAYDRENNPQDTAAIHKWATHFYNLADPTMVNWKVSLSDEAGIELTRYRKHCAHIADNLPETDEIRIAEIRDRYAKARKLAGTFAFIESSTEILVDHLYPAMKLIEEAGESFQKILAREEAYVKLAKYLANVGIRQTNAQLEEKLSFYKGGNARRNELMTMAMSWGYSNHILIQKSFIHGNIEAYKADSLKETDLNKIVVSYSADFARDYLPEEVPFNQMHLLTQAPGMHWANHHFIGGHRAEKDVIAGFNMVVVDVDQGVSLAQACQLMKDYMFLVYTTKRHQTEGHGDRFRMLFPINYRLELDNDEYMKFMRSFFEWLPFKTDESYDKREKKSMSHDGGSFHYNLTGGVLDVLDFIPNTSRNELHQQMTKDLKSLDNLERWFAGRVKNGNRNNHMIRYALCLVDNGWDFNSVKAQVLAFDKKLPEPMGEDEISRSILVTVAKKYQGA
jgi:hypothetical protein